VFRNQVSLSQKRSARGQRRGDNDSQRGGTSSLTKRTEKLVTLKEIESARKCGGQRVGNIYSCRHRWGPKCTHEKLVSHSGSSRLGLNRSGRYPSPRQIQWRRTRSRRRRRQRRDSAEDSGVQFAIRRSSLAVFGRADCVVVSSMEGRSKFRRPRMLFLSRWGRIVVNALVDFLIDTFVTFQIARVFDSMNQLFHANCLSLFRVPRRRFVKLPPSADSQ
jgi:hypothetical protein